MLPSATVVFPAGHATHVVAFVAPLAFEYLPNPHLVHPCPTTPPVEYVPGAHTTQVAPPDHTVPAGHASPNVHLISLSEGPWNCIIDETISIMNRLYIPDRAGVCVCQQSLHLGAPAELYSLTQPPGLVTGCPLLAQSSKTPTLSKKPITSSFLSDTLRGTVACT